MQLDQINYGPLESLNKVRVKGKNLNLNFVHIIIFGVAFLCLYLNGFFIYLGAALFAVAVIVIYLAYRKNTKVWRAFAAANNWQIQPSNTGLDMIPNCVSGIGHSHKSSEVVLGKINGLDFSLHTYSYTTGFGKNQQKHDTTILALAYPNIDIHLLLAHGGIFSESYKKFTDSEKLNLEGDFNKNFSLYAPAGKEVEALQILTPDIMEVLIRDDLKYNVEIQDGWIYFCVYEDERSVEVLKKFLKNGVDTVNQLRQNYNLAHAPAAQPAETTPQAPAAAQNQAVPSAENPAIRI